MKVKIAENRVIPTNEYKAYRDSSEKAWHEFMSRELKRFEVSNADSFQGEALQKKYDAVISKKIEAISAVFDREISAIQGNISDTEERHRNFGGIPSDHENNALKQQYAERDNKEANKKAEIEKIYNPKEKLSVKINDKTTEEMSIEEIKKFAQLKPSAEHIVFEISELKPGITSITPETFEEEFAKVLGDTEKKDARKKFEQIQEVFKKIALLNGDNNTPEGKLSAKLKRLDRVVKKGETLGSWHKRLEKSISDTINQGSDHTWGFKDLINALSVWIKEGFEAFKKHCHEEPLKKNFTSEFKLFKQESTENTPQVEKPTGPR